MKAIIEQLRSDVELSSCRRTIPFKLSCDCDEKFRQCLKTSKDETSAKMVGFGYFTLLRTQCFRVDYPIVDCIERSWFLRRCKKYKFDTKGQKKYQWFDLLEY
ncbi:phospholipase A2 [Bombus terrestris]|uniref:phospholipase A2 n=1 Tax=Bombus terrestris TaxID=30195 RepID=A0A9C6SRL0_BOMTE|nr:phospholipase A2 [Bombus terrestris]